jgi:hypothetical protein
MKKSIRVGNKAVSAAKGAVEILGLLVLFYGVFFAAYIFAPQGW